jgi:hypothetical protein
MNGATAIGAGVGTAAGIQIGSAAGGGAGAIAAVPTGEVAAVLTVPGGAAVGGAIGGPIGGATGALIGRGVGWAMCAQASGAGSGAGTKETPKSNPEKFRPIRGTSAKINTETGEVFVKDKSGHGGEHYEVYRDVRDYEKGIRAYQVWADGSIGRSY